ncbi:hypothetical protein TNCV_3423371 [Trichonephila clavipes]|nr:hypothetical protein TNCV_3423371 [Trichonephila clavipes]
MRSPNADPGTFNRLAICGGAPSCIQTMSLSAFRRRNSGFCVPCSHGVWCTSSMTTSLKQLAVRSEAAVCYRCSLYLRISALNHAELAEYPPRRCR